MSALLGLLLGANAVLSGLLIVALLRLRARRQERAAAGPPGARIVIQIRNPLELARQRSTLAGLLGSITPELVRSRVNQETAKILREELRGRGVDADVRIEGGG